jgi:glutamine synthetase
VRTESRIPGGDVNPYLAFAALITAGLHGIENELELPPPLEGNAYESDAERFPGSLREAIEALEQGTTRLFDQAVTCWERERLYERG